MTARPLRSLALGAACLLPMLASADPRASNARADELFTSAKELRDKGDYAQACSKFLESKRLSPGVGIDLYLGDCYQHLGRNASAYREFRQGEALARENGDERADKAGERARALEGALQRLTLEVNETDWPVPPEVTFDGAKLVKSAWNVPLAVDSGDHVVLAHTGGETGREFRVHLDPATPKTTLRLDPQGGSPAEIASPVIVPAPRVAAPPVLHREPPAPAPAPTSTPRPPARGPGQWVGIGLVGAGAVGVAIGAILYPLNGPPCDVNEHGQEDSKTPSLLAFTGGALAITSGLLVTLFSMPKGREVAVLPTVGPQGGGATLRTSF